MKNYYPITSEELIPWEQPIFNTLEQKEMSRDLKKLKKLKDEK